MPKFSIIVPVYNIEREYLEAALNSVLAQTFPEWECICVDDGSTNDARTVLDEFAAKDPRFKVHHRTNLGVGAARNFALSQACGEWIMFLDGDDVYSRSALTGVHNLSQKYPTSKLIRFFHEYFAEKDQWAPHQTIGITDGLFDLSHTIPRSFTELAVWEFAFHRSIVANESFDDYKIGEDTIFALRCIKDLSCYAYTTRIMYGYRQRKTSACHTLTATALRDSFKTMVHRMRLFQYDHRKNCMYESPNLVRLVAHDYVVFSSRRGYTNEERKILWEEWFNAIGFLSTRPEFAAPYTFILKICNRYQNRITSYALCGILLAISWRLGFSFARILDPRLGQSERPKYVSLDGVYVPGMQA